MAQNYAVINQVKEYSKYGGIITKIILVGLHDREEYWTYVDPNNFNSKNWEHIVRRNEHGFILKGLKVKKNIDKTNIINADSKPIILWEHEDKDDLISAIMDKWHQEDNDNRPPSFDDLFGE